MAPPSSRDERERIYLVGFMGCGKTRIGNLLADELRRGFHDLDAAVQGKAGKTVRDVFEEDGEEVFRDLEHQCLAATAAWPGLVVATGGGLMAFERNRRLLEELGITVWLDVPFDAIVARMSEHGRRRRPLFDDQAGARRLYEERRPDYAEADVHLRLGGQEPAEDVAARLAETLRSDSVRSERPLQRPRGSGPDRT